MGYKLDNVRSFWPTVITAISCSGICIVATMFATMFVEMRRYQSKGKQRESEVTRN